MSYSPDIVYTIIMINSNTDRDLFIVLIYSCYILQLENGLMLLRKFHPAELIIDHLQLLFVCIVVIFQQVIQTFAAIIVEERHLVD